MLFLAALALCRPVDSRLTFCCPAGNDLYRACGMSFARTDDVDKAIDLVPDGAGLLVMEGRLGDSERRRIVAKHLRVYYEDAPQLGDPAAAKRKLDWERVVVTGDEFGPTLAKDRILSIGQQEISLVAAKDVWLAAARVAGFDHLVFGMPKQSDPLLWEADDHTLEASARLSDFSTARFAPAKSWRIVWQRVLTWLGDPGVAQRFDWAPEVGPGYEKDQRLPRSAQSEAAKRAIAWFLRAGLLMKPSDEATYATADKYRDRVVPVRASNGDGRNGILEGYSSQIDAKGDQPIRWYRRADCNSESAMALALSGDRRAKAVARNMTDFITGPSGVNGGPKSDPSKPSYGLVGWSDTGTGPISFYGDDNARYLLALIVTSGALRENHWDSAILRCILANFRTTGVEGFRGDELLQPDIERLGWRHFFNAKTVNMAPHFEAYLWACEIWAYKQTGYRPFLDRAEKGIRTTMEASEDAWTWTNGLQQERARMLLPLAWLIRVDDTPEHRKWLDRMFGEVVKNQVACGAIRDELGELSHGIAGPPRSNAAYGVSETPLLQENGDPLSDLLYTTNFAFLGLHEAAAATGSPRYRMAEDKLADYLCRIQIRSRSHPELDGAWFRAFDYGDWDYWASSADLAWGAWSIETGWSVSWVTSVLEMRERHVSLWAIDPRFKVQPGLIGQMLPNR